MCVNVSEGVCEDHNLPVGERGQVISSADFTHLHCEISFLRKRSSISTDLILYVYVCECVYVWAHLCVCVRVCVCAAFADSKMTV